MVDSAYFVKSTLPRAFTGSFLHFFCFQQDTYYLPISAQWTFPSLSRERSGSVVECRTPEREVGGSKPTAAVLCPWASHFTPRKYWLITQEAVAPSWHDWKIVDWDVKPQHNQPSLSVGRVHFQIKGCLVYFSFLFYFE